MKSLQTEVFVERLQVEAYVGLHDPEMLSLQPISIDVHCTLRESTIENDDIAQTFNYAPVVERIQTLAQAKKRRLIETFAEEIAALCLGDEHVARVVVSIRKPKKFPAVDAVGVTRTFERKEAL